MTTDALGRLQALLSELFQFESKELDFGIYRIMNHKRTEIRRFIDEGLPTAVDEALKGGVAAQQAAQTEDFHQKTDRVKETFGEYAIDSKGELNDSFRETPLGKEYLEARSRSGSAVDLEELEATIFKHVYTFFARYYDNDDFISKRRYSRKQKYAVPYNGEEVYLHWANADQYYVKTGEHFTDYRYKATDDITVHFELTAADTEQNNVKGDRRFFVPRTKDAAYDADARVLTVPFEYRPLNAKEQAAYGTRNQQEKIIEETVADLPTRLNKHPQALAVLEPVGDLMRHLRRYTHRNTSDFFVHKDLKGFLEGELDFYLKNEVIDVDDLEAWGPDRSDGWFEVMRAVKRVGRDVIAFLAQIEDFQKMLFEKKKLVVNAGYCITLDRVPEKLYEEIAANDAQREEWVRLFAIDEIEENITQPGYSEPLTTDFLKANPFLVLDTMFFGHDFKDLLLASVEDLDGQTNGLLIESENFQALNLLQERYREQIRCIYIDPPYNTGGDGFLYKDTYQHSSWLSMMVDRLLLARRQLSEDGVVVISMGREELFHLQLLCDRVLGAENRIADLVWEKGRKNDAKYFSLGHDYLLVYGRNEAHLKSKGITWREEKPGAREILAEYRRLRDQYGDNYEVIRKGLLDFYAGLPKGHAALKHRQYNKVDRNGVWRDDNMSWPGGNGPKYEVLHPKTGLPCKVPDGGWRFSTYKKFKLYEEHGFIQFREDHTEPPILKRYLNYVSTDFDPDARRRSMAAQNGNEQDVNVQVMPSVFYKNQQPTVIEFRDIVGNNEFTNPKDPDVLGRLIRHISGRADNVVDFFAGSGSTGHAVIDLNRDDGGDRKYILVEMGEYFETVLKPRIQKVIYSKDWRDGKPVSREGTSHAFKYMKLEPYEDALDNVAFTHEREGQEALELYGDDYLLRYMLDFETRDSATLLNVEKLAAPFSYTLRLRDGEEIREVPVDLPETFAYLLGLRVRTRKVYHDGGRRYLVYRGQAPERGEVAAIWRDVEGWGEEGFKRDKDFVRENNLTEGADEVFVNGDSFIPEARSLEGVFRRRMFAGQAGG